MIPDKIFFTEFELDAASLLFEHGPRHVKTPAPAHYTRIEFTVADYMANILQGVNAWIKNNLSGKWSSYMLENTQDVVLFFEEDSDAIMFRLLEGDKAWIEMASK
jgi:long-subunit acyl-CoA synthetase (AMP-forming)